MQPSIDRFEAVRKRVEEVAAKAKDLYGVDLSKAAVSFNLRGRVAGWAGCKICAGHREVYFRFNRELISGKHFEDILEETVPHELAHGVCYLRPELGRKHDGGWRRVCLALGGNGQTRHDYEVVVKGRWDYITNLGHKVSITTRHHNHVQMGGILRFKRGKGTIDRYSRFAPSGQPIPAVSRNGERPANAAGAWAPTQRPAPVVLDTVRRTRPAGMSKAEQVRSWIRIAKAGGREEGWVIATAQAQLGMARSMASKYVSENWARA
jgi:predicted SprT family Zn-dependent metalloprotease